MSVVAALLSSGVSAQDDTITRADLDKLEQKYRSEGDSLRGEIGGVKRDSFARTDQTAEKLREEMRSEGDSLRGEIGGVKRDSYEHTDKKFAEAGKAIRSLLHSPRITPMRWQNVSMTNRRSLSRILSAS